MVFVEKVFEKYFLRYLAENKIAKSSDIERAYRALYPEWKNKPSEDLGGEFPLEYLNKMYINGNFADYIIGIFENKMKAGDATIEFIASLPSDKKFALLADAFKKGEKAAKLFVIGVLESETDAAVLEFLADILLNYRYCDGDIVNSAFNALKNFRRGLDGILFKKTEGLKNLRGEAKDMILDILSDYCQAEPAVVFADFADAETEYAEIKMNTESKTAGSGKEIESNKSGKTVKKAPENGIKDGNVEKEKKLKTAKEKEVKTENAKSASAEREVKTENAENADADMTRADYTADIRRAVTEGFLESGNIMLYANLLGRCGNGDSIAVLKEYARSRELKKTEFLEIRNAVERLGGFM
ncbi:MAG: hypothetical protein LBP62_08475 [Clostridiales bacterium]|jgi:hypothetical protein|nr:hypothetical protein [Clostridiales bacterium]